MIFTNCGSKDDEVKTPAIIPTIPTRFKMIIIYLFFNLAKRVVDRYQQQSFPLSFA
jgi:hypothetical protein